MPSSTRVVGLDVGSSALKASQARRTGSGGALVERTAIALLPDDVVQRGTLSANGAAQFTSALKHLWRTGKFDTRDVVIGIGGEQVYLSQAKVPQMGKADLVKAMPLLVRHNALLQIDPEEVYLDFSVIGAVDPESTAFTLDGQAAQDQPDSNELQVQLMAALKVNIERVVRAAMDADLNVVGVDLSALALLRAVSVVHHQDPVVDALIDIGAHLTTVLFHRNGIPLGLYTSSKMSGIVATMAVSRHASISDWDDAEQAKLNWRDPNVAEALEKVNESAVQAVRGIVNHYLRENPRVQGLSTITLTGGSGLLAGLHTHLDQAFNVTVAPASYDAAFTGRAGVLEAYLDGGHSMMTSTGLTTAKRVER